MKSTFAKIAICTAPLLLSGCGIFGGGGDKTTPTLGNRTPILGIKTDNKVSPDLEGVSVIVPPAQANSDWSQAGGNSANTMGHLALAANPTKVWQRSISGSEKTKRLASPPVVQGGVLYVVDSNATVYAMNAATGAPLWQTDLMPENDMAAAFGGGVAANGARIYATNGYGEVAAIDASNGQILWRVKPAGPLRGAPSVANGQVYVMTLDNQIYAISESDGEVQWNKVASAGLSGIFGVATPAVARGTVIAGFSTGELSAYRYENGRDLWSDALSRTSISTSVSTLTDIDASPVIDRSRVYAVGKGGRMASYDLVTGQRIWELNIASISTPVVSGEWVFVITDEAKLFTIARATGKIRSIVQLPAYRNEEKKKDPIRYRGPVLAGDSLIVAGSDGKLLKVALEGGTYSTFATVDSAVSLQPIVANATLYILDDGGQLIAMR